MDIKIPVLDKGYVKCVGHMGDDLSPLEYARMSTSNPTGVDVDKDDRLRQRLWKDQHTSPFEAVELAVELKLPLFCLRQIDRHRTLEVGNMLVEDYDEFRVWTSRNEFSSRYSVLPDEYYIPPSERFQKKEIQKDRSQFWANSGTAPRDHNKQGSGEPFSPMEQTGFLNKLQDVVSICRHTYEGFVSHGMATELARLIIPQNQYTKIRLKANGLHWTRFFNLRLKPDVQIETKEYAVAIARIFRTLFPKMWLVFQESTLHGVTLNRTEKELIRKKLEPLLLGVPVEDADGKILLDAFLKLYPQEIPEIEPIDKEKPGIASYEP